ncbi:hypothetical protein LCGC14_2428470 [marine sediment metagenome]|uniref:Uncharacterized protein n=1 Tax=marine sediment metagenome TaxID=412755 RepID=A0A0F9DZK5_9ZZZZ
MEEEIKNKVKLLKEHKAYVKIILEKFDFVIWDRYIYTPGNDHFQAYGWIKRKDKKQDFISLIFTFQKNSITYQAGSNSTSEYHRKIEEITGQTLVKCHRVEEIVNAKNMIKLKNNKNGRRKKRS